VALARLLVLIALCALWQGVLGPVVGVTWFPSLISIFSKLGSWTSDGTLRVHLWITVFELGASLIIGGVAGLVLGLLIGFYRGVRDSLYPIAVIAYLAPLSVLTPLIISALGFGTEPKIVLGATTAFFIVFFHTISGAREAQRRMLEGLYLMGASDFEVLVKVLAPASRKWAIAGLNVAGPLTLIAIVTVEIFGSSQGLGFLIEDAAGSSDMVSIYAAVLILAALGVITKQSIDFIDKHTNGLGGSNGG